MRQQGLGRDIAQPFAYPSEDGIRRLDRQLLFDDQAQQGGKAAGAFAVLDM